MDLLIVGLDGGTWSIIDEHKSELPFFREVIDEGYTTILESSPMKETGPEMGSFITGKNPGKHGIFSFDIKDPKTYEKHGEIIDRTKIDGSPFWEFVEGEKGIINLPLTYPPYEIDGFMITGFLTPIAKDNFVHPEDLKKELEGYEIDVKFGSYGIIPGRREKSDQEVKDEIVRITKNRTKNILKLMEKDPRLSIAFFKGTDNIGHLFWDDKKYVKEYYELIDDSLRKIYEKADCDMLIFSDHGMTSKVKNFDMKKFLEDENYLKSSEDAGANREEELKDSFHRLYRFFEKNISKKWARKIAKIFISSRDKQINWSETKVYPWPGGLKINTEDREDGIVGEGEYEELRSEIIEKLQKVKDSEGEKFFERVQKSKDVFNGKYLDRGPDIVLFPKEKETLEEGGGEHSINGIFAGLGPNIGQKKNRSEKVKIYDIAPTVLNFLGEKIPKDMDGRVLDVFEGESEIKYREAGEEEGEEFERSKEDEEKVKERLKALGYLD